MCARRLQNTHDRGFTVTTVPRCHQTGLLARLNALLIAITDAHGGLQRFSSNIHVKIVQFDHCVACRHVGGFQVVVRHETP